ncbi:MAG TPA: SgcJ/EcaC family oxidoreductase [Pyrinomonadaceae bacterium]|jgi:uncharacterized protein (TIGR02246 family)
MESKQAFDPFQNDEQAIRQLVDSWLKASESGDLNTMLSLVADDVIFMVPGKEPFGKQEFAENYKQMKGVKLTTRSDIQEIKVLGEWAWMRNFLRVSFTPSEGTPTRHSGYVLTILSKTSAGKWVIKRDANLLTRR